MAIQFKSEEQRKIEKQSKGKLHTARTVLMICSIVAFVILLVYFIVCFNPGVVVLPLIMVWFAVVIVPTLFTLGLIWTGDGYREFVGNITNMIGGSIATINDVIPVLWKSLIYIGIAMLLVIIAYGVLSFLYYRQHKEEKKNFYHIIGAAVIFILALAIFIVALVLLPNVKVIQ